MKKLYAAYYQLTCFGNWHLIRASENQVELLKGSTTLFNTETEQWIFFDASKIILFNGTYSIIKGALSYCDREVLETLKFKIKI